MPSTPNRGEVWWLDFDPQAGHEQGGRRPALMLSHAAYNRKVGLALLCPITNQIKGYPFEVVIPDGLAVRGAILSDHIKSMDWKARRPAFLTRLPDPVIEEVLDKARSLLD
jgi:mRNA interferase MazF